MRSWVEYHFKLLLAIAITIGYHGGLVYYTFRRTYDAWVHIFFADHWRRTWFDHWNYRWYTGFPMISYPPGSQQSVGLLSHLVGLEAAFAIIQVFSVTMVVIGIYRFSHLWVSREAAGYAALLMAFSSSITETIHVFGQLPTTFSLGFLLNTIPFMYRWLRRGEIRYLLIAWSVNAATTAGHHVTTLFGAVFFLGPVMVLAIVRQFRTPLPDEPPQHPTAITRQNFRPLVIRRLRRILPVVLRCGIYGAGMVALLVIVVFPYWVWSVSDPIKQVSIPHASRDSFLENTAAGLVFWIVPYGVTLITLPYVFYKGLTTKAWPMTLSLGLLFFLGTGGTTPYPKIILGGAYEILTLDRFTFWATITMMPLVGEFVVSFVHGRFARYTIEQFGRITWRAVQGVLVLIYIAFSIFTANLTQLRRFQPEPIDMQPIVTFIEKDQHWRWRYLTLGFGDQVAWLGAQTTATSVDGNYHSARRLPELTTTPVERLEGAKFRGIPGIGSLQQFLAVPEKYNLKYIFSNDQFYDPLLYFSGWHRLGRLENGIMVWEREDIPPLPEVLPRKEIPMYQRAMWGILPMGAIFLSFITMSSALWLSRFQRLFSFLGVTLFLQRRFRRPLALAWRLWHWIDHRLLLWSALPTTDDSPELRWQIWLEWVKRLPRPRPAPPSARVVRSILLLGIVAVITLGVVMPRIQAVRSPRAVVTAYYDDLDFRRFQSAYDRLDPETRPDFEQFMLDLSSAGGLRASYAKLDAIYVDIIKAEKERVVVQARAEWITALNAYSSTDVLILVKRNGVWKITPPTVDVKLPPDEFFRQGEVAWRAQGRKRPSSETTAFGDVQDRPELQILSSSLVLENGRYHVVGELINLDVDPADVTVTALIFNEKGEEITWYNAQTVISHKILPKEVTPFRVDFEGVAGSILTDAKSVGDFAPDAFTPVAINEPIGSFQVFAKAVVTGRDLQRGVAVQTLSFVPQADGAMLQGHLINGSTIEAIIPQLLVTYYDTADNVIWVDSFFLEQSVKPQREITFSVPVTPINRVKTIQVNGEDFSNLLDDGAFGDFERIDWHERFPLPAGSDYASVRVSVNYFVASGDAN